MGILNNLIVLGKTGTTKRINRTSSESIRLLKQSFFTLIVIKILYFIPVFFIRYADTLSVSVVTKDLQFDSYSMGHKFILVVLIAPIIEELTFRLNLRFSKWNFLLMVSGICFVTARIFFPIELPTLFLIIAVITLILSFFVNGSLQADMERFWNKKRLPIFYFFVVSFSVIHLSNYDLRLTTGYFIPFLIVPHLLAGFVYSYVRLEGGILLAICLHMLNNSLAGLSYLFSG